MNLGRLLSVDAYRQWLRGSVRRRPELRAITTDWRRWIVRLLLMPVWPMPCTITTYAGTRYRLGRDPVDDVILRHFHRQPGLYFPVLGGFDPEGVILDVGAHHGFYAIEALRRYRRCSLIAIEPDPLACAALQTNAELNRLAHRIRIIRAALGAAPGTAVLERTRDGSWANQVRSIADRDVGGSDTGHVRVALRTLDDLVGAHSPVIVKCNAEGAEFALVPQLVELGWRPALIVLMIHPAFGSPATLIAQLTSAGYDVRDADEPPRGHRFHCVMRMGLS